MKSTNIKHALNLIHGFVVYRVLTLLILFTFASLNNREATAGWVTQPVDTAGVVGSHTSLAFDLSGKPAISYFDVSNADLKYAHDANGNGSFADAGEIITVDSAGNVGWYTSLAFDASGNPAISYLDPTSLDLKYAHDANGNGSFADAGEIITVDSTGDVGRFTSLAFDASGNPAISYYDNTNRDLKYAHDANGNGSFADAGEIITADTAGFVGEFTSLAFDASGNPAISYYDVSNSDLKYAHDANGNGSFADAGEIIPVDSAGSVGWYTSLAFDLSGNPAISYLDNTNFDLKYAHDANGNGSFADAGEIITVDSAGIVGEFTSLAFDASGNPAISYFDNTNLDLKYAHDANGNGSFADAGEIITVDSTGDVGFYTSLAFDASGNLAISYFDNTNDDLKYARFVPVPENCINGIDDDGDGLVDCRDPDCFNNPACVRREVPVVTMKGSIIYGVLLMAAGIFYMMWRRRR